MDIGTLVSIIGTAKSFLDKGSEDRQQREPKSLLDIYDDVKSRNYDITLTQEEMAAPGKVIPSFRF
jgi:hypothetical protein